MSIDYEKALRRMLEALGSGSLEITRAHYGWYARTLDCNGFIVLITPGERAYRTRRAAARELYGVVRRAAIALLSEEYDFDA